MSLLETDYSKCTYGGPWTRGYDLIRQQRADYHERNKEDISRYRADYHKRNKEVIKQQRADYRESNKEAIKQQRADYYKLNKEAIKQRQADYRESIKQSKKYYCDICEIVCAYNKDLQQHLKTSKHLRNKSRT